MKQYKYKNKKKHGLRVLRPHKYRKENQKLRKYIPENKKQSQYKEAYSKLKSILLRAEIRL